MNRRYWIIVGVLLFSVSVAAPVAAALPASYDLRQQLGEAPPIKNQQQCSSDWATTAASAVEWDLLKQSARAVLSTQFLMDCNTQGSGCNGGSPQTAMAVMESTGVPLEADYPYTAQNGVCRQATPYAKITGSSILVAPGDDAIRQRILDNGAPVVAIFDVYNDFYTYYAGVYVHSTGAYTGTHVVLIIGWGEDQGGKYWICQNSWGSSWGEAWNGQKGYFRIRTGQCNMGSYVFVAQGAYLVNPPIFCFGVLSTDASVCSGHGNCAATDQCQCAIGYAGTNCESCAPDYYGYPACTYCLASTTCSGAGVCAANGTCLCETGRSGAGCQDSVCECNGTGSSGPVTVPCGQSACGSDSTMYACGADGWAWTGQSCGDTDAGACQCSGTGPSGPVTVNCGESACGSDFNSYSCSAAGWASTGQACGCQCQGVGPGGAPVTVNCGQSACGSDFNTYACGAGGWSWTGQACSGNADAGAATCECTGTGLAGASVTVACGQSACGSDATTYSCGADGWSWTGQACSGNADAGTCQCSGTGPGGAPVTVACGQSACGSDSTSYSCGASGWTYTGQACTEGCTCAGTGPGGGPIMAACGQSACGSDFMMWSCALSGWSATGNPCAADAGVAGPEVGADVGPEAGSTLPNGYVISGAWHGYAWTAAANDSTINPADFSSVASGSPLCVSGLVAPRADWGGWAAIGVNLNQAQGPAAPTNTVVPTDTGIIVNVTNTGGSSVRVQIQGPNAATDANDRWCAPITGAGGFIPWSSFNTACWDDSGTYYSGQPLAQLMLLVPGSNAVPVPFAFCLDGFASAGAPDAGAGGAGGQTPD